MKNIEVDKYTLLHKLACNSRVIARVGVVFSRAVGESENAAHEWNNHDMHANECNKMFIIHTRVASCLFPREIPSNSPFECIDSN